MTTSQIEKFLDDLDTRTRAPSEKSSAGLEPKLWFQGMGDNALEVALATAGDKPLVKSVRKLWHARWKRRPNPVLLVVAYEAGRDGKERPRATLCGPTGENPPVVAGVELSQAERLASAALAEPNQHAGIRLLKNFFPEIETDLPGVRNAGVLSPHEMREGVRRRDDWQAACTEPKPRLALADQKPCLGCCSPGAARSASTRPGPTSVSEGRAAAEGGTLEEILAASGQFSAGPGERLRERVYFDVVPGLAPAVGRKMGDPSRLSPQDLELAYEQTLIILFQIHFVA